MNISEILKANGIESDKVETITESINREIGEGFVSKKQYSKRKNENQELRDKLADIEASQNKDEYKNKYETIEAEYNKYKENVKNEKITNDKLSIIKSNLKKEGVNDKLVNLLIKEIDLNSLELEGESLKGWDNVSSNLKENYSDFYGKIEVKGHEPKNPPRGNEVTYSKEDIDKMSTEEINANWSAIQASIKNI